MSYVQPKSEMYFMNVPFDNHYKNVVNYASATARNNAFIALSTKHVTSMNIIRKDTYIELKGDVGDFENFNYVMYRNPDVSSKWWFAFIQSVEYTAANVTRINIQTDIWQSYLFNTTFYKSFIERGHVDDDTIGKWTAPEGVGFSAAVEVDKNAFSDIDFTPAIVLDSVTMCTTKDGVATYKYGGNGETDEMTGIYRFFIRNQSHVNEFMSLWSVGETSATTVNHLNDLIGFSFVPNFVFNGLTPGTDIIPLTSDGKGTGIWELLNNKVVLVEDSVTLSKNTLASGYTAHNNKMYTSLCKAYKLWNMNGLSIPLKPELLKYKDHLALHIYMRPMSATYKVYIGDYKDLNSRYFDGQYSYSIPTGFNQNTGTAQATSINQLNNQTALIKGEQITAGIKTAVNALNSMVDIGMDVASANYGGAAMGVINTGVTLGSDIALQKLSNENQNYNQEVAYGNAFSSISKSIGNNSDRTNMHDEFHKIRLADCSPTYEECAIIDDFLSMYGYAIQEIYNPTKFLNSRKRWNYIKTNGINLKITGVAHDEDILRGIFDSGVTIWHGLDYYGNYNVADNGIVS